MRCVEEVSDVEIVEFSVMLEEVGFAVEEAHEVLSAQECSDCWYLCDLLCPFSFSSSYLSDFFWQKHPFDIIHPTIRFVVHCSLSYDFAFHCFYSHDFGIIIAENSTN